MLIWFSPSQSQNLIGHVVPSINPICQLNCFPFNFFLLAPSLPHLDLAQLPHTRTHPRYGTHTHKQKMINDNLKLLNYLLQSLNNHFSNPHIHL